MTAITRRALLAAIAGSQLVRAQPNPSRIKLGLGMLDLSDATLKFTRQLGLEWLACPAQYILESHPRGLVPAKGGAPQRWRPQTEPAIRRIKEPRRIVRPPPRTPPAPRVPPRRPGHARARPRHRARSRNPSAPSASRLSIPVLEYNFLTPSAPAKASTSSPRSRRLPTARIR